MSEKQVVVLSRGKRTEFQFPDGIMEGVLPSEDERDEALLLLKRVAKWASKGPLRAMLLGLVVAKGCEVLIRDVCQKVDLVDFSQPVEALLEQMRAMLEGSGSRYDKREVALPAPGGKLEKIELPDDNDEAMAVIEKKLRAAKARESSDAGTPGQYI